MSGTDPIPKDRGDTKQDDSVELPPELQREALNMGLQDWSKKIIDDDTLVGVIQARLEGEGEAYNPMMTDFSIEPTMEPQKDGSRLWGIRIAESAKTNAGAVSIGMSFFKHIEVARFHPEDQKFSIEQSFAQAATNSEGDDAEDKKAAQPAVKTFLNCTMSMLNKLTNDGVEFGFDPSTHTLATVDELSRVSYVLKDTE